MLEKYLATGLRPDPQEKLTPDLLTGFKGSLLFVAGKDREGMAGK